MDKMFVLEIFGPIRLKLASEKSELQSDKMSEKKWTQTRSCLSVNSLLVITFTIVIANLVTASRAQAVSPVAYAQQHQIASSPLQELPHRRINPSASLIPPSALELVIQQQQQHNQGQHQSRPESIHQRAQGSTYSPNGRNFGGFVKLGNSTRVGGRVFGQATTTSSYPHLLNYTPAIDNSLGKQLSLSRNANGDHISLSTSIQSPALKFPATIAIPADHQQQQQQQQQQTAQKRVSLLEKICTGTSHRMLVMHNTTEHYQNLAERYRNCTYVMGNLELTGLSDKSDDNSMQLDLSFLESIREITGYLLIAHVDVKKIRMPNLQVIRGRDLFKFNPDDKEEFAIILFENGLRTLELPNFREILSGSVGFYSNQNLCHIRTISWDEIINWPMYRSLFIYNGTEPECSPCDGSCQGSCWGEGPELCQKTNKLNCSPKCSGSRCFGPSGAECCHAYCAGGCTGPRETDCLSCRNLYDNGTCVQECPSMMRYNPSKFLSDINPEGKYAYGATCVKECPEHLLRENSACVRTCPPNKRSVNGECVPCGGPCPKNCQGVEMVHSGNIDQLINCTVIEGSISILDASFTGNTAQNSNDQALITSTPSAETSSGGVGTATGTGASRGGNSNTNTSGNNNNNNGNTTSSPIANNLRYKPMHPSRLEVFKTLREITGYLNIQASHPDFKNLSYFRNLKTIGGRQITDNMFNALSIIKTSLVSLNLRSLRKVRSGKITIEENPNLCFADSIDWMQINITRRDDITTRNNAESVRCLQENLQCHSECAKDGCWGPGPDECLSCNNYKVDDYCVDNCTSTQALSFLAYDAGGRTCRRCHAECKGGCTGSEARQCWQCKNVMDGPYCVAECPIHKYNNNGTCDECDKSCVEGCSGPSNKLGEGGCNSCGKAILNNNSFEQLPTTGLQVDHCLRADEPCPEGYYQEYIGPQSEGPLKSSSGKLVCRKCHHRCKSCDGMGTHTSVCRCAKYVAGDQCEDYCPRDYYADEQQRLCLKCSPECNGCLGPSEADCITCRVYRIYYDSSPHDQAVTTSAPSSGKQLKFNCTAQCPPEKPHRISESNMLDPYCSNSITLDPENPSISPMLIIFMLITPAAITICLFVYRCQVENDKTVKLTMHLSGIDDVEPLNPSNMKPNLAPLHSIKETELRKGKILGSGFGGTVYQGLWVPEGDPKATRPVAIKVLRDNGQSNMNKEFLDEAYIMASVNHPNLVRLLAVCMTPNNLMLVTQLMPLGCLLDYVKNHKHDIGSKNLLEWCKQIARGMAYLEEHRMVHRDLALRNVLLQTSGRALVSDFGLAKFLELDQSEYHSGGGRLPIKWLAPECIRERKFTHKSDVWAFGVTIWELLTFGQRPFEEYDTKDVPMAIEKGARLHQPSHMSAEVYKVMYSCWFYNPEQRPHFRGLAQSFVNFARDPERYLICGTKGINYKQLNVGAKFRRSRNPSSSCRHSSDDEDTNSDVNSSTGAEEEPAISVQLSAMPDLTPSTHNRLNESRFGFELRHHGGESEGGANYGPHLSTPTLKKLGVFGSHNTSQQLMEEDVFTSSVDIGDGANKTRNRKASSGESVLMTDANNNNAFITSSRLNSNVDSCWSMHHTVSTNSIGQKSEQPTDMYDYLLPSPCTDEHSHFSTFYTSSYDPKSVPITPTSATCVGPRNPPHSAGLAGVLSNEDYFMTHVNYVNQKDYSPIERPSALSASNGNIPHSLV